MASLHERNCFPDAAAATPKRAKEKKKVGGEAEGVEQTAASKRPRREAPTIRSEPVRDSLIRANLCTY